jgi:hypothetical protein
MPTSLMLYIIVSAKAAYRFHAARAPARAHLLRILAEGLVVARCAHARLTNVCAF